MISLLVSLVLFHAACSSDCLKMKWDDVPAGPSAAAVEDGEWEHCVDGVCDQPGPGADASDADQTEATSALADAGGVKPKIPVFFVVRSSKVAAGARADELAAKKLTNPADSLFVFSFALAGISRWSVAVRNFLDGSFGTGSQLGDDGVHDNVLAQMMKDTLGGLTPLYFNVRLLYSLHRKFMALDSPGSYLRRFEPHYVFLPDTPVSEKQSLLELLAQQPKGAQNVLIFPEAAASDAPSSVTDHLVADEKMTEAIFSWMREKGAKLAANQGPVVD